MSSQFTMVDMWVSLHRTSVYSTWKIVLQEWQLKRGVKTPPTNTCHLFKQSRIFRPKFAYLQATRRSPSSSLYIPAPGDSSVAQVPIRYL